MNDEKNPAYTDRIRRLVDKAPPLTAEQRTDLYPLLAPLREARRERLLAEHKKARKRRK
jgi:hypothetical protein